MGEEAPTIVLVVFGVLVEGLFVSWLLRRYSNPKRTEWYVSLLVWFGWFFSFAIVFFIPMDVSTGRYRACIVDAASNSTALDDPNNPLYVPKSCAAPIVHLQANALQVIWSALYWTTFVLCWVVYPVLQSYVLAAHFTFNERLVRALKENLILYSAVGFIGLIGIIWLVATRRINASDLAGFAMAAGNTWGLLILFALLSYGLIEIPKRLWRRRNRQLILKSLYFQTVGSLEDLEKSKEELEITIKLVRKYADTIRSDDPFRPFIDIIVKKCPSKYHNLLGGEGTVELKYDKIVALHSRIMSATMAYARSRSLYESLLEEVYEMEDKVNSVHSVDRRMKWSFKLRKTSTPLLRTLNLLEWIFYTYLESILWVFASFICAILSICVVWSESFFWIPPFKLSIFYWFLNADPNMSVLLQWTMIFVPVLYITYCAYWSMFQLRIFNYYRLIPHQLSDSNSILFSAYYVCRLTAPMIYNVLQMIDDQTSAFNQVMGIINFAPLFGDKIFSKGILPLCLIILCGFNVFNVYAKLTSCFCFKRFKKFTFDEDFSDERIDRGRDIVVEEKSLKEKGLGLSIDQDSSPLFIKNRKKPASFFREKFTFGFFKKKKEDKEDQVELLEVRKGGDNV